MFGKNVVEEGICASRGEDGGLDSVDESFKNIVVKYYGCSIVWGHAPNMALVSIYNHGKKWGFKPVTNSEFREELQALGFEGIREASSMGREKRDSRIKKVVSLIIHSDELRNNEKRDPIDVEYNYKNLKERKEIDLEKEAEDKIEEWIEEWEKREFSYFVEKNKEKAEKGKSLRKSEERRDFKADLQGLIGYCLFWEEEDYENEIGTINIGLKDQLEREEFDIDLQKALKDIEEIYREELEIDKVREDRWKLSGREERSILDKDIKRLFVDEDDDVLRVYEPVEVEKRSVDKKVKIRGDSEELEFLKDFDGWSKYGEWQEDDGLTVVIRFADYECHNIERALYRCFRLYSLRFLKNKLEVEFEPGG